jgi:hypothetical protein
MTNLTIAEIERELRGVFVDERRYSEFQREIREDVKKIEEGQRRLLWGLITVLVGIVVQVVQGVVQSGALP